MGSKDRGNKEARKPKTAKKKEKAGPVIPSRVKVPEVSRSGGESQSADE